MSKVFGITGWKNSGKTTLVTALVEEFIKRGFTVSTVKNAHHSFEIDSPGTDSHKHRHAGANETAIVSEKRWAIMHEVKSVGAIPTLDTLLAKLAPCDLVIVEGFKASKIQKIECIRVEHRKDDPIWWTNDSVVAIATNEPDPDCTKIQLNLDDVSEVADFIAQTSGLGL